MKKRTTVICLTVITIADMIWVGNPGAAVFLWVLYGLYKLEVD